jgi:hypothetical protein
MKVRMRMTQFTISVHLIQRKLLKVIYRTKTQ